MSKAIESLRKVIESNALFGVLVGTAVDGIMVIDEKATVRFYNDACERLFGYTPDEVLGRNVKMLMPAPYRAEHDGYIERYLDTGIRHIIGIGREVTGQRKDGSTFPMYLSVGEGRLQDDRIFVGIVHDITDRNLKQSQIQELQAELLHVTRMTAMGQMSSALAHELNQPLTAILSYANAAAKMASSPNANPADMQEVLKKVAGQATRAGNIIRRLRAFVEKREPQRVAEDINLLIEESAALGLIGLRDAGIRLNLELDDSVPAVTIDRIEIQQVLVNLMRNAAEALVEAPRREVTVTTMPDGEDFVGIAIADTGPGLAPEVSSRLFQAFVSTKPTGMGMGLNICRTIVEAHGGRLWCDPNPGGGAIFRFRLPVHRDTGTPDE